MLKSQIVEIDRIRVPVKRRKTLDPGKVAAIAESLIEDAKVPPIQVRRDGENYVLVEGFHRLEARKALGDDAIESYVVQARKH